MAAPWVLDSLLGEVTESDDEMNAGVCMWHASKR